MTLFITLFLVAVIASFLGLALIFRTVARAFNLPQLTYTRAVLILLLQAAIGFVITWVGSALGFEMISVLMGFLISSIAAYWLCKKFTGVSPGKFALIWITNYVVGTVIGIVIMTGIRSFIALPFVVAGDAMAPAYVSDDYLFIERWDTNAVVGDVVIADVIDEDGARYYRIARVVGVTGDEVDGEVVPPGMYYLASDNPTSQVGPGLVSQNAIIGKPILNVGRVDVY